jgi:hypothetical protein
MLLKLFMTLTSNDAWNVFVPKCWPDCGVEVAGYCLHSELGWCGGHSGQERDSANSIKDKMQRKWDKRPKNPSFLSRRASEDLK